ncbi:MAG: nuclear transport factor 2 family protein [Planctomycetes bacterium]|nr:nuclear transport factor 2 family protein [Planctomycetota bacterium]
MCPRRCYFLERRQWCRPHIYIDLLSLYKINGDWNIVNKLFVHRSY